jgi:hypothetical protein
MLANSHDHREGTPPFPTDPQVSSIALDFGLEAQEGSDELYRWTFLECNPNGQWGWLPDAEAIADAFAETLLEGWST